MRAAVLCIVCAITSVTEIDATLAADRVVLRLYDEALAARERGDFPTAIERLERAARRAPKNAEILLLLGTIYGFVERFADAQRVLEKARHLAPHDNDILLEIARIKAYRHDFARALYDVGRVLKAQPRNVDALALAGRIAYYQGELQSAEDKFHAVLAIDPDNLEGLLGLGDVRAAQGDVAGARRLYEQAKVLDPTSPEVQTRLTQGPELPPRYRLDSALSFSRFARRPTQPWYESLNQLTYSLTPATDVHGRVEVSERFGKIDTYLQGGIDHRFDEAIAGYLYLGGTPNASFREIWTVMTGSGVRLLKGDEIIAGTVATLDLKGSLYHSGYVYIADPGLEQYFLAGRLWITAKAINTFAAGEYLPGYLLRVDGDVSDTLHLYGGYSRAGETENNLTAETRSQFAGIAWASSRRLTWHLDFVHDDREGSYIRYAVALGITVKF